ncbi:unnamed protein product [Amoebophrya sp. A25]|nr:unnamed protein product [Amoebophrya sp. A25]|eukprot:GSA25T00021611001.1
MVCSRLVLDDLGLLVRSGPPLRQPRLALENPAKSFYRDGAGLVSGGCCGVFANVGHSTSTTSLTPGWATLYLVRDLSRARFR